MKLVTYDIKCSDGTKIRSIQPERVKIQLEEFLDYAEPGERLLVTVKEVKPPKRENE